MMAFTENSDMLGAMVAVCEEDYAPVKVGLVVWEGAVTNFGNVVNREGLG